MNRYVDKYIYTYTYKYKQELAACEIILEKKLAEARKLEKHVDQKRGPSYICIC
jgi:hypothetical protein